MNFEELINSSIICDAHLHIADILKLNLLIPSNPSYTCISCAHSIEEFNLQQHELTKSQSKIFSAFGLHPQHANNKILALENLDFLQKLLEQNKIDAVGEAGFDFFTQEFKNTEKLQKEFFESQLELCLKFNKPLIIHGRKCTEKFFYYAKELKKLSAVIFHSYMGTFPELKSLINREINCYFTFGKQILNGNKKAIECVTKIPLSKLLLETDSPFQTLKGEVATLPEQIADVYYHAAILRGISPLEKTSMENFCKEIYSNFLLCLNTF